jgi:hypothetical protein
MHFSLSVGRMRACFVGVATPTTVGPNKKPPQRTLVEDDGGSGQDATVPLNIVTYTHRPKRSPRKRKAAALEAAIITPRKRAGISEIGVPPAPISRAARQPDLLVVDQRRAEGPDDNVARGGMSHSPPQSVARA